MLGIIIPTDELIFFRGVGIPPTSIYMGMGQNLVPLVNIKIAGKWMFIPLKMVLIGIDSYPYIGNNHPN